MQVSAVITECASSKHKISIAILSLHHDQVKCMQQKLENQQQNNKFLKVKASHVDDYQPGKADVVMISTVGAECSEVNTDPNNFHVYFTWARCVDFISTCILYIYLYMFFHALIKI